MIVWSNCLKVNEYVQNKISSYKSYIEFKIMNNQNGSFSMNQILSFS